VNGTVQRRQLGSFLKARRAQMVRGELGFGPIGGRSTGLRREEVAVLSGVSVTWYTWLEQGRDTHPSRQVLDSLARTLRLSAAECSYAMSLAGYSAPQLAGNRIVQTAPGHVLRLLDELAGSPAYVLAADWQILGWTRAFEVMYPNVATVPEAERNLLWLVFMDPYVRERWPGWEVDNWRFLAEFRAEAGPRLADPPLSTLVGRLREASPAFRDAWERHDVGGFTSPERLIRYPVGDLHLERHRVRFFDPPDLQMVIYTPVQSTDTPARLRRIIEAEAG
jgi:transcriptional regulator with XRE-family HTH domain